MEILDSISPGYMGMLNVVSPLQTVLLNLIDTALNASSGLDSLKELWKERTPMERLGNENELNNLAVYLASDASTFMTGSDLVIDV